MRECGGAKGRRWEWNYVYVAALIDEDFLALRGRVGGVELDVLLQQGLVRSDHTAAVD